MIDLARRLRIEKLGSRGEGVAHGPIFTPYALPGETIIAEVDGERGHLVEILEASPDRVAPFCPQYRTSRGCPAPYAEWKRGLVVAALNNAGVKAEVVPLVDAHGAGRRRATLHARVDARGRVTVGFMQARAHAIVDLESCPLFAPGLARACWR